MVKQVMLGAIRFYQGAVSPYKKPCCRFYPTCSSYAYEAVSKYGAAKGAKLAFKRLMKCHPFHEGGYDPVP